MHMPPGLGFAARGELGFARIHRNLFDGYDRVAAARHDRAGHHLEAVGGGVEGERRAARRLDAGDTEPAAAFGPARECDAIHGHAIEGGCVALRANRRAEYASGAGSERNLLFRHRRDGCGDCRIGLGGRQHGRARFSSACRGP
jgi:hypothetical protein